MRRTPALLLAALFAVTLVPLGEQPASASCVGPSLTNPGNLVLQRGATAVVSGEGYADGCQDTGTCTGHLGCTHCDYGPEPEPMRAVSLTLRQHGQTWLLGTADAETTEDRYGGVTWTVTIPGEAKQGRAWLVPGYGEPIRVRIG